MQQALARLSYATFFALALCAGAWSPPGLAANGTQAGASSSQSPEARYKSDVARCRSGDTNQDLKTCMREAGAALNEARHHRLMNQDTNYDQNATDRCNALPANERQDCITQMSGGDTTIQGSVESGGILRETTITIPASSTGTGSMGSDTMGTGSMGTGSMGTGSMGTGSMGSGSSGTGTMGATPSTGTMGSGMR